MCCVHEQRKKIARKCQLCLLNVSDLTGVCIVTVHMYVYEEDVCVSCMHTIFHIVRYRLEKDII